MVYKCEAPETNLISGQMNLIFRARMLWRDIGTWLTTYMTSLYSGYPNLPAIANKLYRIPLEYGNLLRVFFGNRVSEDYINLLSNHVITLENIFYAQMVGDQAAVNEFARQIYQNIDSRAAFLAQINPYWEADVWRALLIDYNNMLLAESTALLARDYEKSINVFDQLLTHSTVIGDYFSEGIFNYLEGRPT